MHSGTLGIVGGGQLGRMLHQAAIGVGVDTRFLAERGDDPAAAVASDVVIGSAQSLDDLVEFSASCDVVTFEHEVVNLRALEHVRCPARPSAAALAVVADKLAMRAAVERAGCPSPPWRSCATTADLADARSDWTHIVVKLPRGGYDGRGVFIAPDDAELASLSTREALLVEQRVNFRRELAIIACRRPGGECVTYDPVVTVQHDGQCVEVRAGVDLGAVSDAAREIAIRLATELDVVGLLAVELFELDDGSLLVNELAVRPHNTGHHTIDACVTSQFENHVRAVCDLPLGSTALRSPAVMVNLIGNIDGDDPRHYLAEGLATDPQARIHLYGKRPRHNRKVGHVTICDTDIERAAERAWRVAAALLGATP